MRAIPTRKLLAFLILAAMVMQLFSASVFAATPATIFFNAATFTITEGNSGTANAQIAVRRAYDTASAVTVQYAAAGVTAAEGQDYEATSGTLSFASGETLKIINVPVMGDTSYENDETFTVTLSNPGGGAKLGSRTVNTVTIVNDDQQPLNHGQVELSAATYNVAENGTKLSVTVNRAGGTDGAVSVDYITSNGTALSGTNYTAASGTLNWADADGAAKTFDVNITDNDVYGGDKTFNIMLSNVTGGASLGTNYRSVATIQENEAATPGTINLSAASYSVVENTSQGKVTITVTRTGGSVGAASVNYTTGGGTAVSGVNYTTASGTLNWAEGDSTSKTISVPIINNSTYDGNKTFNVTLADAVGAALGNQAEAEVTITEDEIMKPGTLALASATYTVNETAGTVTVTVARTGGADGAASIDYATSDGTAAAPGKYTAKSGTLNWNNKEAASKTIVIPIVNTANYEGNKNFNITISNAAGAELGAQSSAVITIVDDETPPVGTVGFVNAEYSVDENDGTVAVKVARTGGTNGAVTVDYATNDGTAKKDTNYTSKTGTLSWNDGEAGEKTITINITDNALLENINKQFTVDLSNATGGAAIGTSQTTATIVEDEQEAPALETMTFAPSGIAKMTKASLAYTGSISFVYKANAGAYPAQVLGAEPPVAAAAVANGDSFEILEGMQIGVWALDGQGKILAFSQHNMLANEISTAPAELGYVEITRGSSVGATRAVAADLDSLSFVYKIQADVFTLPALGTTPPNGTQSFESGSEYQVTAGHYIAIIGLDGDGKVLKFSQHKFTANDIGQSAPTVEQLTFNIGNAIGKTKINVVHAGAAGFRYKVHGDGSAFSAPLLGTAPEAGTTPLTNGLNLTISEGHRIAVWALDMYGKTIGFTTHVMQASEISTLSPGVDTVVFEIGTEAGSTKISSLSHAEAAGYAVKVQDDAFTQPFVGSAPDGALPYVQGGNIPAEAGKHVGVYAVDTNGLVLAFSDHTVLQNEIAVNAPVVSTAQFAIVRVIVSPTLERAVSPLFDAIDKVVALGAALSNTYSTVLTAPLFPRLS